MSENRSLQIARFGGRFGRVEMDGADGIPVANPLRPTARGTAPSLGVECDAVRQNRAVSALVSVVGGDVAQGAVQVLGVVPGDELFHPPPGVLERGEGLSGIARPELQRPE